MEFVCDIDGLERVVGTRLLPALLKSIGVVDEHVAVLLARSPIAIVGYEDADGNRRADAVGGSPGFTVVEAPDRIRLPMPADAAPGGPVSTMYLIPGWREALRINGHLDPSDPAVVVIGEAFVHCGKAVLRSDLWGGPGPAPRASQEGAAPLGPEVRSFLAASRFLVMTSQDAEGAADASPKGDPAGFVQVLDDRTLAVPDRRGNRRTDTFHNLVERPSVSILALVPSDDRVLELRGSARITDDEALRAGMAVRGKVPHAALVLDVEAAALRTSPALGAARLWDPSTYVDVDDLPTAGRIWTDHIKANETSGLKAAAIRLAANGRAVQAGTEIEYQRSLY